MNLQRLVASAISLSVLLVPTSIQNQSLAQEQRPEFRPPFFAFQTGFTKASNQSPKYIVDLVKKSGFDGVELMGTQNIDTFLTELERNNLKLYSLYLPLYLDKPVPFSEETRKKLVKLKGKLSHIWLHIHLAKFSASDPRGDAHCVKALREMADWCEPLGIEIGVYHHVGLWAEKFSDAIRIARKVDRKNVGAVFNLCHYLRTSGPENLESEITNSASYLKLVSINGADDGETSRMGWDRLIQPLGQGTFDVSRVLHVLKKIDYQGPIGFQGFAIKQKPEEFFPTTVKAYRSMLERVNAIQTIK